MDYSFVEVTSVKQLRQDLLTLQRQRNDLTQKRSSLQRLLKASRSAVKNGRSEDIASTLTLVVLQLAHVNKQIEGVKAEIKFSQVVADETAMTKFNAKLGEWLFRMLGGDVENEV